ncbi:MAG: caspase family protein, partial [Thermoanaerobaculia bacterium]|nr:caspase family protein [Thermoanaerobaculia bacterium]
MDSEAHRRPIDPAHSAGLFVGVSEFEDSRIREVPYAVDDAVDLAHLFVLELGLITPESSVLALSGEPKKPETAGRLAALLARGVKRSKARQSDVYRYLGELGRSTGERGLFVVTVASHGFTDQGGDFIVASESVAEHRLRSGVSVDEVFDDVAKAQAPRRLVLLDTCRDRFSQATRGAGDGPMSASFAAAIARATGQVVLSGATHGSYSYDDLERGNGVFSGAVIDGLRGEAAAGPDGWITVHTLAVFLQERVSAWVKHNRPSHVVPVQGIGQRIDGPGSEI